MTIYMIRDSVRQHKGPAALGYRTCSYLQHVKASMQVPVQISNALPARILLDLAIAGVTKLEKQGSKRVVVDQYSLPV